MQTDFLSIFENALRLVGLPRGWDIKLSPRFLAYTPAYEIEIETKSYRLETAKSTNDLLDVFELRHKIFLEDKKEENQKYDGYDLDKFDSRCDHIIIKEKETGKIVGTYRIIPSNLNDVFYSETEFHLDEFVDIPGAKLELGRACIHHAHRNGPVIDLLWRGIAEYVKLSGARYLFGCSSINITDPLRAKSLYLYLRSEGRVIDDFKIAPVFKHNMSFSSFKVSDMDSIEAKSLIPPLLRSYFNAGSMIYGEPALDEEFECVDFFTILDIEKLNPSYRRRYFK